MIEEKKMWFCDGDKLGEQSPFSVILSQDPRPIKERLGYDPFENEIPPSMITIQEIDFEDPISYQVDTVEGLEVGSLLATYGKEEMEILRVVGISTIEGERVLLFDRGFGDTSVSDIKVGDKMLVIGWEEPKDLYPLMVCRVTKDSE